MFGPLDTLYAAFAPDLRDKTPSMLIVFKLFIALCLEVRSGTLTSADLRNRFDDIFTDMMAAEGEKKETPLSKVQKKYPELHLHDRVLTDDVLIEVLCEGIISRERINSSLRTS